MLAAIHGTNLIVRPPVPVTVNKAGANYKSEMPHLQYAPRQAYDEWLAICEGIVHFGGDALFEFESADDAYLGVDKLRVAADGSIYVDDSTEVRGHMDDVMTGRVFTANGPWIAMREGEMIAVLPNMLAHRQSESTYYRQLLGHIAADNGGRLTLVDNPHRWEGMADVTALPDHVILTYTVAGHYDQGLEAKSLRSSRAGCDFAADQVGIASEMRIYAELVYPHFHGDTVHFSLRPPNGSALLIHYPEGLWADQSEILRRTLGEHRITIIERNDAVEYYAGNSRQVGGGILIPDQVTRSFENTLSSLGLETRRIPLAELFGKAGGGPGCATLYTPTTLSVPPRSPLRYSQVRSRALAHRDRLPSTVTVDPDFFAGKRRG